MLKSPELTKMYMDLTKTPEYRKQSMTVMHDAMQNPIFRLEVMNLLKTVVQEELQPKVEKKVVSKAVQAAISKVVGAAKVGAKENKEEANNKKAGLKTSLFSLFRFRVQERNLSSNIIVNGTRGRLRFIYRWRKVGL